MDNYWPRQDVAIYDTTAIEHEGEAKVVMHPEAWVRSSGKRITETVRNMAKAKLRRHPSRITDDTHASRAPAGSRPYNSLYTRRQNKNPDLAA